MNQQQPTVVHPYGAQPPAFGQHPAFGPAYGQPPAGGPPARKRRTGLIAGLVGGGAVVLGGLGFGAFLLFGPKTLVTDEVEAEIGRITQEQASVAPANVSCPDDIPVDVGSAVTYTVTQTDDRGNLTITHTRLLAVAEVEGAVSEQLTADVEEEVVAVCSEEGRTVLVNEPGTAITCTAVNVGDTSLTAEITVEVDDAGTVSYEFV